MPWREATKVSSRREFVDAAHQRVTPIRELCRRYGIAASTAYKWLGRFAAGGSDGLVDASRRPDHSPAQTPPAVESAVLAVREAHPAWGGRKIRRWLLDRATPGVPAASTITAILRRHGCLTPPARDQHAWQRFEHPAPNDLWQMDFKGHFALATGRCHPLTVLDDHSRFNLCLAACGDERRETVQAQLIPVFERYGLPRRMQTDNGAPWGTDADHPYTVLGLWLIRYGIEIGHSAPYHPQSQGKDERFHRTLGAEVLQGQRWCDLGECQAAFTRWRDVYNTERPHEALQLATPASRYHPSPWRYTPQPPPIEYGPDDAIRKVDAKGDISWHGRTHRIGKAFKGQPVAVRPTLKDGVWEVFYCRQRIHTLDLRTPAAT